MNDLYPVVMSIPEGNALDEKYEFE